MTWNTPKPGEWKSEELSQGRIIDYKAFNFVDGEGVRNSLYVAGQALGFLNLRLRLNDYLLENGGYIGYSIRPSERGKGYAKESLRQGLQVAKGKNIKRALVTCSTENPASRAVILANGGQLEDIRHETERYWIDLE